MEQIVSASDLKYRNDLIKQFLDLGDDILCEAFGNLQYFTSQVGCPNVCTFCSQSASPATSQLTPTSLRNLLSALHSVVLILESRHPTFPGIGHSSRKHKPGVLFLYQDTDVASDTNLQDLVEFMYTNFKLKSRISTVGWSRHNTQLQALHCYQPSMYNRVRYIDSLILMASITL